MEKQQLILPISFAVVALIVPFVAYFWVKRLLGEEGRDQDDSYLVRARGLQEYHVDKKIRSKSNNDGKSYNKSPPDLLEIEGGGTQSSDSSDSSSSREACQASLSSSRTTTIDDVEAQKKLKECTHQQKMSKRLQKREDIRIISRQLGRHRKGDDRHRQPKDTGAAPTGTEQTANQSIVKQQQGCHIKSPKTIVQVLSKTTNTTKEHKIINKQVLDVHSCTSETCELCCRSNRHRQVQFVTAPSLQPAMIDKLRNAPSKSRWWEIGESFYDLYQQAQQYRTAENYGSRSKSMRGEAK